MAPLVPEAPIMKTVVTSTRDSEPSTAAVIGGILALGVVRAIARAQREQSQLLPLKPKPTSAARRIRAQPAETS